MKKTKPKKIHIEFDEKHLSTLVTALEVYSRLRSGQIAMAMGDVYIDKPCLEYNDKQVIESVVRTLAFRNEEICTKPNSYYGVGCLEMKDGTVAWEIKKTIEEYLHYQQNDGYRNLMNVSGDGAPQISEVPIPKIVDPVNGYWKPQKEFKIPQKYQETVNNAIKNKDYNLMWNIIDKCFKKNPLPKGSTTKIEQINETYYVIVEKPYKTE